MIGCRTLISMDNKIYTSRFVGRSSQTMGKNVMIRNECPNVNSQVCADFFVIFIDCVSLRILSALDLTLSAKLPKSLRIFYLPRYLDGMRCGVASQNGDLPLHIACRPTPLTRGHLLRIIVIRRIFSYRIPHTHNNVCTMIVQIKLVYFR